MVKTANLGAGEYTKVKWKKSYRIIASRFPPIDIYERVTSDPDVWDALMMAEQLTNPRLRDQMGDISLVAEEDRVHGHSASYVMSPFTHVNPMGTRFSDGSYGVLYVAKEFETALKETLHHFENFCRDSNDPPRKEDFRVLIFQVDAKMVDVSKLLPKDQNKILDADDYSAARLLGQKIKSQNENGVLFKSVRHENGKCLGIFRPPCITLPVVQERHIQYHWNGKRVDRYFDYTTEKFVEL